jgi:hypothetical protein
MQKSRENAFNIGVDWIGVLYGALDAVEQRPAVSPHARTILDRRFGLKSGRIETLEAIGRDISLTRERVRQIEAKSLTRISQVRGKIPGLERLSQSIELALLTCEGVVSKRELLSILGAGEDASSRYNPSMAICFLVKLCGWEVEIPKSNPEEWTVVNSSTLGDQVRSAIDAAVSKLNNSGPLPSGLLMERVAAELGLPEGVVNRAIASTDQVRLDTNGIATPQNLHQWQKVAYVLRRLNRPTHFTGIATAVRSQFSDRGHVTDHAVHAILGHHEPTIFRRVGPGTYGLADWRHSSATSTRRRQPHRRNAFDR